MNRNRILLCSCILIVWAAAAPARAQEESARLVEEMASLNRSMERMVAIMETIIGNQHIDILLRRIEIMESRLIPLESELRRAERAQTDVEARVVRMQEELEEMEDVVAEEVRDGVDQPGSDARRMQAQLERVIESETARAEEMRNRVQRLEAELADGRDEIAIMDEQLRELLEQR
jgi:hypothetical protein